jgi:hypothetical protein
MLKRLTIAPIQAAIHIGEVALIFHGQLAPPKCAGTIAGIARASAETRTIVLPKGVKIIRELFHRITGHAPAIRVEQIGRESGSVIL